MPKLVSFAANLNLDIDLDIDLDLGDQSGLSASRLLFRENVAVARFARGCCTARSRLGPYN